MKSGSRTSLWRGALGGAIGGFLWVWLLPAFKHQDSYTQYARLLTLFFIASFTAIIGTIIGWIVVALHAKTGKNYGVLMRIVIGVVFSLVAASIAWATLNMIRTSEPSIVWSTQYWLLFGILVGVLAGGMVGDHSASH